MVRINQPVEQQPVSKKKPKSNVNKKFVLRTESDLKELMSDDKKKTLTNLVVEESCLNDLKDDLKICDFQRLRSIEIQRESLQNLNSLVISKNPLLKSIVIQCGQFDPQSGLTSEVPGKNIGTVEFSNLPELTKLSFDDVTFYSANKLIISNLPKLSTLEVGYASFRNAQHLILAGLPALNVFDTQAACFVKVKSITLTDVPFENGSYSRGNMFVFYSLKSSGIVFDSASKNLRDDILSQQGGCCTVM